METKHTPGPYPLKVKKITDDTYIVVTNQGNHYATTHDPAAARLIKAIPQMLAALKALAITGKTVHYLKAVDKKTYNQALRAIAKAEGQAVKS